MDITTLDMMAMVRVDCSFWSARAKLQKDDLPWDVQQSMPPEQIATLGSKRLFDPAKLKIFNTLKARAHGALDKKCVRFLGGWATHEDRLPELAEQLATIASDFDAETRRFLDIYVEGVATWAQNFPGWENILLNAVPKVHELRGKFAFAWQMFKIAPQGSMGGFAGNNLNNTLTNLERDVIVEVARDIRIIYRECFDGKEKVTKKAFRPMQTLIDKVRSLGFIHHHLIGLEGVLVEAKAIGENAPEDEKTIRMIKAFLIALSTPQGVQALCDEYCEQNKSLGQVLDPFWLMNQPSGILPPLVPHTVNTPKTPVIHPANTSPVQPVGLPKLPPGWISAAPGSTAYSTQVTEPITIHGRMVVEPDGKMTKVTPDFIAQAKAAVETYEDRQMGIEPIDLSKPVGNQGVIEDDNGLW